jgi:hypothetical protein
MLVVFFSAVVNLGRGKYEVFLKIIYLGEVNIRIFLVMLGFNQTQFYGLICCLGFSILSSPIFLAFNILCSLVL